MKRKFPLIILIVLPFFLSPITNFGQAPNLGTAANFVLFSGAGAIGNTGISQITGNVGTNVGAITGFGNINGVMHTPDPVTAQADIDLQAAWLYLANLTPTAVIGPVLGSGQILFAGVDTIAAAGSVAGSLTLDAQGNSNAIFVIKTGGALTTAASASISLINGAMSCNVFWVAEGAISMATFTVMRGTLIAHNGAIDMGAGGIIDGRMLSTTGAVSVYGTLAFVPLGCSTPVLTGPGAPLLNSVVCYALFSSNGVVSNSGITNVSGDVGTNFDSTTGFNPLLVSGTIHFHPDASTSQCELDLQNLYSYLDTLTTDITLLYPAQLGNSLVLTPHVYSMNAAALFTDTLFFNAEGDTNAVFVIQINGALTASTNSFVDLINGAQAKNLFWVIQGAATINTNSTFCGTIVCNNGALILNSGVTLDGRSFTTGGALNTTANTINNPYDGTCNTLGINLLSFTGNCIIQNRVLNWEIPPQSENNQFSMEKSGDKMNWRVIESGIEVVSSPHVQSYSVTDNQNNPGASYYRLSQTDLKGNLTYSFVLQIDGCNTASDENLIYFPNPSNGKFDILFTGDKSQVNLTEIFNSIGEMVYHYAGFQANFDLSNQAPGVFFVNIHYNSTTLTREILIEK
jgi:hypothetical protein